MNVQRDLESEKRIAGREVSFPLSPEILPGIVRALDVVMIGVAAVVGLYVDGDSSAESFERHLFTAVFVTFCYLFLASKARLDAVNAIMRPTSRADDVLITISTATLLFLSVVFTMKAAEDFWRSWMLAFSGGAVVAIIAGRVALQRVVRRLVRRQVIGRSMAVLGVGEQSERFLRRLRQSNPFFVSLCGVFSDDREGIEMIEGVPVLGGLEQLVSLARQRRIDDIVVAMPWNADRKVAEIVEQLKELPVNVYLSTDLVGFELAFRPAIGDFTELPMFEVVQRPLAGWAQAVKRIEDYVLATLAIVVISPLLALIALAIKLDSPGPVLFRQRRLGFNNQEFDIYKFRSMHHRDHPEVVVRQARRRDPRVTRVGRVLRATSLDELPQLFNVLDGTMSLVGPRPHALSHNHEYGRQIRGYFARHRVKPGITGWAQVNGYRGETEQIEKMEARIRHDIYYAENWSLFFDLRILVTTLVIVFFQKSAY